MERLFISVPSSLPLCSLPPNSTDISSLSSTVTVSLFYQPHGEENQLLDFAVSSPNVLWDSKCDTHAC